MKKIYTMMLLLLSVMTASAQMKYRVDVWSSGLKTTYEDADSITFAYENQKDDNTGSTAVDLGLSVKWATCNLGAATPQDFGNYYAWGETETKDTYTSDNYAFGDQTMSKYNSEDGITEIQPGDDAASKLLGDGWRMPTEGEMKELLNKCIWEWTTVNNVNGYKVIGANSNYIFIPAAGFRNENFAFKGSSGYYWTSTIYMFNYPSGDNLVFNKFSKRVNEQDRYVGMPIRPVKE